MSLSLGGQGELLQRLSPVMVAGQLVVVVGVLGGHHSWGRGQARGRGKVLCQAEEEEHRGGGDAHCKQRVLRPR